MAAMGTFAIIGGTGKVGTRLSVELSERGHRARPLGRSSAVPFDWNDAHTWPRALSDADAAFIVGPGSAVDWSPTLAAFLDVAQREGIGHAVLLSARGVEFLPGGAVDRAEHAIRSGPIPWTVLRPTHFAQNFTEAMFVPQDGAIVAPVGDGAEPFIDAADIAEVAAVVLEGDTPPHRVWELSGPGALTFAEAAAVLQRVSGVPTRFIAESSADHRARLAALGTPDGYITWREAMLEGIRSGADAYLSDGIEAVLGRPGTTFEAWAEREVERRLGPSIGVPKGWHR